MDHVPFVSLDLGQILQNGIINEPVMEITVEFIAEKLFNHLDCSTLGYVPPDAVSRSAPTDGCGFAIFPQPARDKLTIRRSERREPTTLTITDITGRTLMQTTLSSDELTFPLSLPPGIYFAAVAGAKPQKFVVE
jgi:hypothetical protein